MPPLRSRPSPDHAEPYGSVPPRMIDSICAASHDRCLPQGRLSLEADMSSAPAVAQPYPKELDLAGEPIVVRLLEPSDAAKLHDFVVQLSASDLLFLQRDVTDPREIDAWLAEVAAGDTVTLIAEGEGTMFGESTLRSSTVPWTRHVGTVRVITAPAQRGRGL